MNALYELKYRIKLLRKQHKLMIDIYNYYQN